MAMSAASPKIASAVGRRRNARLWLGFPARLVLLGGQQRCRLLNLSVSGAMLGIEPVPPIGSVGFLRFASVEAFGTVVWAYTKHCGIDFDEPLPLETVTAMRHLAAAHPHLEAEIESRALRAWVEGQVRIF